MLNIWQDGRSGILGKKIGNLVLTELSAKHGNFELFKAVRFVTANTFWVGRYCNRAYIGTAEHWAILDAEQHEQVCKEAEGQGKEQVVYLFITGPAGSHDAIDYWTVPGEIVKKILGRKQKLDAYIRMRGGQFFFEGIEVTKFHRTLVPSESDAREIGELVAMVGIRKTSPRRPSSSRTIHPREAIEWESPESRKNFPVPLSKGRSAVLSLPVPLDESDVNRIKGWVDLMSDVLMQEETESQVPVARDKPNLVRELRERGVIGAWKDRDDIGDSSAFARKLREQAEKRQRDRD